MISYNEHQDHEFKNGNIISYQLSFTKPKTSNVFDQHYYKVANIVQINQLHVLCKMAMHVHHYCLTHLHPPG